MQHTNTGCRQGSPSDSIFQGWTTSTQRPLLRHKLRIKADWFVRTRERERKMVGQNEGQGAFGNDLTNVMAADSQEELARRFDLFSFFSKENCYTRFNFESYKSLCYQHLPHSFAHSREAATKWSWLQLFSHSQISHLIFVQSADVLKIISILIFEGALAQWSLWGRGWWKLCTGRWRRESTLDDTDVGDSGWHVFSESSARSQKVKICLFISYHSVRIKLIFKTFLYNC